MANLLFHRMSSKIIKNIFFFFLLSYTENKNIIVTIHITTINFIVFWTYLLTMAKLTLDFISNESYLERFFFFIFFPKININSSLCSIYDFFLIMYDGLDVWYNKIFMKLTSDYLQNIYYKDIENFVIECVTVLL